MLTLLNIINYLSGKPLPFYVLVLITIALYYYLITYHWESIVSNNIYLTINIILLIVDITALIIIFSISHNDTNEEKLEIKKSKKSKKSKKLINIEEKTPEIITQEKSILSLYDKDKEVSLNTYGK